MDELDCPQSIINILSTSQGHSLLGLNSRDIERQVLTTGLVDGLQLRSELPGKLLITLRPPALTFFIKAVFVDALPTLTFLTSSISAAPSSDLSGFVATTSGKTFQLLSTGVLSQIESDSKYFLISKTIPNREYLTKVFGWLYSISVMTQKPDTLYFIDDMIIFEENDRPDLVMNFSDNPASVVLALQQLDEIISRKRPKMIDFRFTHPILR